MPDHVSMERWGKDHWSTLAYVECCCVDHKGKLNPDRMRPAPHDIPIMLGRAQRMFARALGNYPTILRGGELLADHGDWDCVSDMIREELLTLECPREIDPFFGNVLTGLQEMEARRNGTYHLTDRGHRLCDQIRRHKAAGGSFGTFVPDASVSAIQPRSGAEGALRA